MLTLDGSQGEGGGQILRTSLALSIATGKPFRLVKIRARRSKPGLMRQHLTAVQAAAKVGDARLQGASLGSMALTFEPGRSSRGGVAAGEYSFSIGSAGSATLVLQTVLPPLLLAKGESRIRIQGGTHNMNAPPFDFLAKAFVPILNGMGASVEVTLIRHGFYPAGGGEMVARVSGPQGKTFEEVVTQERAADVAAVSSDATNQEGDSIVWRRLALLERGDQIDRQARAVSSRLPETVAQRELETIHRLMSWPEACLRAESVTDSPGPGNVLMLEMRFAHVTEVISAFGAKGIPSEAVARVAADQATRYLSSSAPVGEHLADQLLLPMALGAGGVFRTGTLTLHAKTNIDVIKAFLDVRIETEQQADRSWVVRVGEHS